MYLFGSLKKIFSKNNIFGLCLVTLVLSLAANSFAAKGSLDRTFGSGGKAVTPAGGIEKANDAVVQTDGKIVVVGGAAQPNSSFDFLIQRYTADGALDADFGTGGKAALTLSPRDDIAYSVALQTDGKILVAGYYQQSSNYTDFCIVRLLPDGRLDQTFGTGGRQIIAPTATTDIAVTVAIQNLNGVEKIIVGGNAGTSNPQFSVARLDMSGQIDTTFGEQGIKTVPVGGYSDYMTDMAIDGAGRIVAVGISRFDLGGGSFADRFGTARFLPDGALDPSFSEDGTVTTGMLGVSHANAVAIQKIGDTEKIVVGGVAQYQYSEDFALLRYNDDGSLDNSFGGFGKIYTWITFGRDEIEKLLVSPDGKLTAVGFTRDGTNQNFALARYNPDGSLDKTFGACGRLTTDLGSNTDIAYGAAVQADGKIIAVGESTNSATDADFAVVRYTNGGQATATSTDFDGDGREDVSVYRPSEGVWYANCSCQGFRAVRFGLPTDTPVAADFDGDGRTDEAVYRAGTWYINRSSDQHASVINFGLETDVPTVGDYDGDDRADISVWRPSTGVWYVLRSSDWQYTATAFGINGDKPVPADYDADGKTDFAVYRQGDWWIKHSSDASGNLVFRKFGSANDTALPKDFDGDGRADLNVYRASEGLWYQHLAGSTKITRFGNSTDKPAPADYNGDGKTDIAVFRSGQWHVLYLGIYYEVYSFGLNGDFPTVIR